jgi:hypothetical protein
VRAPPTVSPHANRESALERKASSGNRCGPAWYGNGKLFTPLWLHGVILADPRFVNPDGSIWMKFPWWGVGVSHKLLKLRGQRLDGPLSSS